MHCNLSHKFLLKDMLLRQQSFKIESIEKTDLMKPRRPSTGTSLKESFRLPLGLESPWQLRADRRRCRADCKGLGFRGRGFTGLGVWWFRDSGVQGILGV